MRLLLVCTAVAVFSATDAAFSCKDQNNKDVDWFYGYKLPELRHDPRDSVNEGYGLMYLDAKTVDGGWVLSNTTVYYESQAIGYTLQQYYDNKEREQDVMFMLYNDEHPTGGYSSSHAHSKGVMFFDGESGFWLIHSAPKFPQAASYAWAQNARYYGQSFMCISLPYSELQALGNQFYQMWPYMYAWNLPKSMEQDNTQMAKVLSGQHNHDAPFTSKFSFVSSGGTKFVNFAKSGYWGEDLYYSFVAPNLRTSLTTETWQNGGGNFTSWCNGTYSVNNAFHISLPAGVDFSDHKDHSKFAVSTDAAKPWVCVGDINRQHGQLKRGGGTMCQLNAALWKVYNASISIVQPCAITRPHKTHKDNETPKF